MLYKPGRPSSKTDDAYPVELLHYMLPIYPNLEVYIDLPIDLYTIRQVLLVHRRPTLHIQVKPIRCNTSRAVSAARLENTCDIR
jgi:hypothetical protein